MEGTREQWREGAKGIFSVSAARKGGKKAGRKRMVGGREIEVKGWRCDKKVR